ncbi:alanine racemase [Maribius pontilimi]|uniref:Alanine racemase n=1 Tax=Palleronia pontilimi TaxID=1964209 RepID=A0A934MDD2_9RHOB|nr:alanine racemase [Palleronia pontilimi]MBJ3762241.1 alanine racemase [Palleronia pontilimi]
MAQAHLKIDLEALAANWRALDKLSADTVETGAVVKADGYGLGVARVARALADAGARQFYVAQAEEGVSLRDALGEGPEIFVFSGHMAGDSDMLRDARLIPLLNSIEQMTRHFETLPGHAFGVQIDSGMNRLGLEPAEWAAARGIVIPQGPRMVMSHLACADEPDDAMNARQLAAFREMTQGLDTTLSLSATGGILLGADYHFDATRPGIGLYGGLPFADAQPVAYLNAPVIQIRDVAAGETVGYGAAWLADQAARVATVQAGYADGLIRAMGDNAVVFADDTPCPLAGRVSMDMLTVDVTHLDTAPDTLQLLGAQQGIDDLADAAGTIGYEILTSLGARYRREYS